MMKILTRLFFVFLVSISLTNCDGMFGSKDDAITDDIFEAGKRDPLLADDIVGYAALLPFWTGFDEPNDIFVGYDQIVYVTDKKGLHVLDQAGRSYLVLPFRGANAVTMDRNLNLYVSARDSIASRNNISPTIVKYDLPVIFKLRNANGAGPVQFIDTLRFPFDDATMNTFSAQVKRLDRTRDDNYEQVQITGLATLADNSLYVTRTGPSNMRTLSQVDSPDNIVLEFQRIGTTEKMKNIQQIRAINPLSPTLISGLQLTSISTLVGPPQRERLSDNRAFLIAQGDQSVTIPYRVLWVTATETPDGMVYAPNTTLLAQDTSKGRSFMYETYKFQNPADVTYTTDGTNYILVVDAVKDSLYLFQSNGIEGVNPPTGSSETKAVNVSFGGHGVGGKQFNQPSGVAHFRKTVFVVDKGNNRISRFKLTTDFE